MDTSLGNTIFSCQGLVVIYPTYPYNSLIPTTSSFAHIKHLIHKHFNSNRLTWVALMASLLWSLVLKKIKIKVWPSAINWKLSWVTNLRSWQLKRSNKRDLIQLSCEAWWIHYCRQERSQRVSKERHYFRSNCVHRRHDQIVSPLGRSANASRRSLKRAVTSWTELLSASGFKQIKFISDLPRHAFRFNKFTLQLTNVLYTIISGPFLEKIYMRVRQVSEPA